MKNAQTIEEVKSAASTQITTAKILKNTLDIQTVTKVGRVQYAADAAVTSVKQNLKSLNTLYFALASFGVQATVLTWQLAISKSIDKGTFWQRIKNSALSTVAGVIGGAAGGGIGTFIGNLFCPGLGGVIGFGVG